MRKTDLGVEEEKSAPGLSRADKELLFEQLKSVAKAVVQALGKGCEVLLHDLSDLEHSIIWIEGNVTNRRIGGSLTDLGLTRVRAGEFEDLFNYTTYTKDGKTLKSSSIFLKDKDGKAFGALCINLDLTPFLAFQHELRAFCGEDNASAISETFSDDIHEILETMLAEGAYEIGKHISSMAKEDKIQLIAIIDEKGGFQIKKAVPFIAKRLGVSRYTVYNYLNEARARAEENHELEEAPPSPQD